jgi:hypothetical protein
MTKNQFQKELSKLEGLLSSLNKKNKGNNYSGGGRYDDDDYDERQEYNFSGGADDDSHFFKNSLNKKNKRNNHSRDSGYDDDDYDERQEYDFSGGAEGDSRFFKLVSVNGKEVDGGRYELPLKTKSGKQQTRGPKDKASSAFSEICQKNKEKGECSYKFAIQETTRGSNKKVYHYQGKRVKLSKPVVLKLKDSKSGEVKEVVKRFKNIITSLGSDDE